MAAVALDQSEVARLDPGRLVEALGRLHNGSRDGLVPVAGEEIDIIRLEPVERVDLAGFGKRGRAARERLSVGRAPIGLHALEGGLTCVLRDRGWPEREDERSGALGAGKGAARDDARADDVLGVRHLELPGHIGARR